MGYHCVHGSRPLPALFYVWQPGCTSNSPTLYLCLLPLPWPACPQPRTEVRKAYLLRLPAKERSATPSFSTTSRLSKKTAVNRFRTLLQKHRDGSQSVSPARHSPLITRHFLPITPVESTLTQNRGRGRFISILLRRYLLLRTILHLRSGEPTRLQGRIGAWLCGS